MSISLVSRSAPQTVSPTSVTESAIPNKEAFFEAIRKGDLDGVSAYLEAGGDVEASEDYFGHTALMILASMKEWQWKPEHEAIFNYLILHGADVHARSLLTCFYCMKTSTNGDSVLHIAAHNGAVKMIPLLVRAGVALDVRSEHDWQTPLHIACGRNRTEFAKALIQNKADPNIHSFRTGGPYTPLSLAILKENLGLVKFLVGSGADVNAQESSGCSSEGPRTSLVQAIYFCRDAIPPLVVAGARISDRIVRDCGDNMSVIESLKEGIIRQIIHVDGVARLISEYSQYKPSEVSLEESTGSDGLRIVSPAYNPPWKLLSAKPTIMKAQRKELVLEKIPEPLVKVVLEYAEEECFEKWHSLYHTVQPVLIRLSWQFQVQNEDPRTRSARFNAVLEQYPDDFRERFFSEIFTRSRDPEKPQLGSPEEQINWAKEHIGADVKLLSHVLYAILKRSSNS